MKSLYLSLVAFSFGLSFEQARADAFFYEPFNYSANQLLTTANSGITLNGTGNDTSVVAGSLNVPGLMAPIGNSITNGGIGAAVRFGLGQSISSGTVYYSFAMQLPNLSTGANSFNTSTFVGALLNGTGTATYAVRLNLQPVINAGTVTGYQIGISKAASTVTYDSATFTAGQTVFVVGSYTFNPSTGDDSASLWINPDAGTFGAASAPTTLDTTIIGADVAVALDTFTFRQNTTANTPAEMQFDELRVGYTWADVTPGDVPEPSTLAILGIGAAMGWRSLRGKKSV